MPAAVSYGSSAAVTMFCRRRSNGSRASSRASSATSRSMAKHAPVLDPAHGMANLHGDGRHRDVFGHQPVLAAEAAADVRRNDAHLVLGQAQNPGKAQSLHLTSLGREVHNQLVRAMVPIGKRA